MGGCTRRHEHRLECEEVRSSEADEDEDENKEEKKKVKGK